jgi:hypothetical protein
MKRDHAERRMTIAIADLLRFRAKPDVWWSHFPAGEARSERTGALLKRMGTRAGSPDFILFRATPTGSTGWPFGLELKTEKGRQSDTQKATQALWERAGGKYELVRSYQEAVSFLETWGFLVTDHSLIRNSEAA